MPDNPSIIHSVSGTVYDKFEAPLVEVSIEAFDKDLRTEQLIGKAITNSKGFYTINYNPEDFLQIDCKTLSLDIFIRVTDATGKLLEQSPVHFNVPPEFKFGFKIDSTTIKGFSGFDAC